MPKTQNPVAAGVSPPRFGEVTIRNRGHLPHWEAEGSTYFVTFHLADSLPRAVLEAWLAERKDILKRTRPLTVAEKKRLQELFSQKVDACLDAGKGACLLARPGIAGLIRDALLHFDGQRYRLFAWCVMPNHVHVVFRPLRGYRLAEILHSWKPYTARTVNLHLGLRGAFWQREYYDHLIRNEEEFRSILRYVMENPVKANLMDWPWVGVRGQDALATAGEDAGATS